MNYRKKCLDSNIELVKRTLISFTWGNASVIDRHNNIVYIKPSGVDYCDLNEENIVAINLSDGTPINSKSLTPSSDTSTHLALFRSWPEIGGIVHTHSEYATAHAQIERDIAAEGTTHADYFFGNIPCTRRLTEDEVCSEYELNTGLVIVEEFAARDIDPLAVPACLVAQHGPFAWGKTVDDAVFHASVLEQIARMAVHCRSLDLNEHGVPDYLLRKHYERKHGPKAYYGQSSNNQ